MINKTIIINKLYLNVQNIRRLQKYSQNTQIRISKVKSIKLIDI